MKVALVELAIWVIWWTAMVLSVGWLCPITADQENDSTTLRFNTITFNTKGGTQESYRSFIRDLRNQLKGSEVEKIPVLRSTVPDKQRFLLVKLQASKDGVDISVTLVVDVTTMYVLGYGDKYGKKDRAHYFKDKYDSAIPIAKREKALPDAISLEIPFGFSYDDLETAAGTSRTGIPLGIESLGNYIGKVYGLAQQEKKRDEAKFLLIAIQMLSEAARFKYLENKIDQEYELPDKCMIALQTVWDKISQAIQKVNTLNIGDKIDVCPGLKGLKGDKLKEAIIQNNHMGILKYEKRKNCILSPWCQESLNWNTRYSSVSTRDQI